MNKYILNRWDLISLDTETLDVNVAHYSNNIDIMFLIEKDGTLIYNKKEYDVKAGDILLKMYCVGNEEAEVIIINNEKIRENYKRRVEYHKKDKPIDCECIGKDC